MPESSSAAADVNHSPNSIEKVIGNKRFSVDDIVRLVTNIKALEDTCHARAVDENMFDTNKPQSGQEKKDVVVDPKTKNFLRFKDFTRRPPSTPIPGGTKLVFMDNLNPDIKETDVIDFFKEDGKIVEVTFLDTKILGCGDVRFETSEAAEKALKRNGELLIDRPVRLVASDDRNVFDFYTPTSEQTYLFIGNLSLSVTEDDIIQFFENDGLVSVLLMSEEYPFEGAKQVAHVKFPSSAQAYKAFQQHYGQILHGRRVEFALATEKTVWYSSTPSSSKPPQVPKWGPLSGQRCSDCKKNLGM